MTSIWLRILPNLAAIALVAGILFSAYHHGVTVTEKKWVAAWHRRDADDKVAALENEINARAKEQANQQSINKAIQNGQRIIDQATADANTARVSANRLRSAVDTLARRLAGSQSSGNSCTATASQAATRAAMVFADMLQRADQRAGDLADFADQSHVRGLTCEQAYDGVSRQ